jgi:hypothetical protein
MDKIRVYLEIGKQKTFAGAIDWPGWNRSGKDEKLALQILLTYSSRYADAIRTSGLVFSLPASVDELLVVERFSGNASTDFGVPSLAPSGDMDPVSDEELARFKALLQACWHRFDEIAASAVGKELRKGPRGGGRDLDKIIEHVRLAETAYIGKIGGKFDGKNRIEFPMLRQAVLQALEAVTKGHVPQTGPRGGKLWSPRYFVRRAAWHMLDHTWEIEDRLPN